MSELLTISIRRKLDKGDKITTNEIRALLATVQAYKNKIEELEHYIDEHNAQVIARYDAEVAQIEAAK